MPEGLMTTDGTPVDVAPAGDADFRETMAAAAKLADAPEMPAPAKKDPEAPFGRTKDGTPKKRPGGRPAKPQVMAAPAKAAGTAPKDFRPGLRQLFGTAWSLTSLVDQADAGAILLATPALVEGWNGVAQRNPRVGKVLDYLTDGAELGGVAIATLMLGMQIAANHGAVKAEALAHFGVKPREELEAVNAQAVHEAMAQAA